MTSSTGQGACSQHGIQNDHEKKGKTRKKSYSGQSGLGQSPKKASSGTMVPTQKKGKGRTLLFQEGGADTFWKSPAATAVKNLADGRGGAALLGEK